LTVSSAFVPGATDLSGQGRALVLGAPAALLPRLGTLAHAAGFTWVRRQGPVVQARQATDELVSVRPSATAVAEGATLSLEARPQAAPHGGAVGAGAVFVAHSAPHTLPH